MTNFEHLCSDPKRIAEVMTEIHHGMTGTAFGEIMVILYSHDDYTFEKATLEWLNDEKTDDTDDNMADS